MVFSSLFFVYFFLALNLIIYFRTQTIEKKNIVMLVFSLIFYSWGGPRYLFLLIANALIAWICALMIEYYEEYAKLFLVLDIIMQLSILAVFKYLGLIFGTVQYFTGVPEIIPQIALPIGISFYTFQLLSYVIDVYRGEVDAQPRFWIILLYASLFHQCIAGPIVRYKDVAYQLDHRRETLDQFTKGVCLFCVGLGKKVLIANQMGALWDNIRETGEMGWLGSWVGIIAYTFQIYFDFSGYSDMACGLGNMLGFEFLKNFNYPYISKSITEFWRRWHISLGTWFREYVYIPLGGNRMGVPRQILNLLIVWFLTGFWHGADFNFIFWGLYFGLLLVLEKFILKKWLDKAPAAIQHIYALFFIVIGWVLFYFSDLGEMGAFFQSMFSFGGAVITPDAGALTLSYLPMLLVAALASTPLMAKLYKKVENTKAAPVLQALFCCVVLGIATALLVSQSYNPFLYFRF